VKIKKMTATFGALENATLVPGDGLTVISGPNEAGKSTWAAFLKVMLYGLDTRERDKVGYLAEKNRYQPWSGAPMSGELQLEWQGRDITLRRTTNRSGPMQQFEAVYTTSGDPVPGLTAANVGEQLLGVGKDTFVRTALVGQDGTTVTAAPELERRVAALATTGEEGVSASAVQRTLKDWRNRRRSNRSNGLIPELEGELQTSEQALRDLEQARCRRDQARQQLETLGERREQLLLDRELHHKQAVKALNTRCGEALERLEQARQALTDLPDPDPVFRDLTPQQARELADTLRAEAEERRQQSQQNQLRASLQKRRKTTKALFKLVVALFGFGGLALVIAGFIAKFYTISFVGFGCMMATVAAAIVFVLLLGRTDQRLGTLAEAELAAEDPVIPDADAYIQWLSRRNALQQEVRHCQERYEDLLAQGAQPLNTLELLPMPQGTPAETAAQLTAVERETLHWQTQLDQAIGALRADPLELEARCGTLEQQIKQRTAEYDALDLALSVLEQANIALRERFSPTLNRETAALFSRLTGGSYSELSLSRDFSAMVECSGPRSALYLSAGTVDQLYLSLRLALCRLSVPDAPILLDDALCAFDDGRMALALETLHDLSDSRQILLFSCHKREAQWAAEHGIPTVSL